MAILAGIAVWLLYVVVSTAHHWSPWKPPTPAPRSIALVTLALAVVAIVIWEWALLLTDSQRPGR
jgi:hypothetical protein